MKPFWFLSLISAGIFLVTSAQIARDPGIAMNNNTNAIAELVARIHSLRNGPEEKARIQLLSQLYLEQQRLNSALLALLNSGDSSHKRRAAAYLLGLYGLDYSVPKIAEHITLKRPLDADYVMSFGGEYPVRTALVQIGQRGQRVIQVMVENLETSDDEETRRLSADVLRLIFPSYPDLPRHIVEKAIEKQAAPEKKKSQDALRYFAPGN